MGESAERDFLLGHFTRLFAQLDGRNKPNASDKKLAANVVDQAVLSYTYYDQMRKRKAGTWVEQAA